MKNKIIIITGLSLIFISLLALVLYNEIPRVKYEYSPQYNGYLITKSYGQVSSYEIPSTYRGKDVVGIADGAFQEKDKLKSLDLSNTNIKIIGQGAFFNCSILETIIFPSSLEIIDNNAFMACSSIKTIDLSHTTLNILGGSVFFDCTNLKQVSLPKTLEQVGSYCFYNTNLENLSYYSTTFFKDNALLGVSSECQNIKDGE